MQLKCVAIDEDPLALELIKKYIGRMPSLQLLQVFSDVAGAGEFLQANVVDLMFIDISMHGGMELITSLKDKTLSVFTTSYKRYALEGFELGAVDYLLKPLDFERFSTSVNKAVDWYHYKHYSKNREGCYIWVRSAHKLVRIDLDDIEYIEGSVSYIRIHMSHDLPILTLMSLKALMEKLPASKFRRIHKSYIVPVTKIKSLQHKKVLLFSQIELPVGDSYMHTLRNPPADGAGM